MINRLTAIDVQRRVKAPSHDYIVRRAALDAVSSIRDKLGPWQTRSVNLLTMGQHLRARGRRLPHYAEEALTIVAALEAEKSRFAEATDGLADEVRTHGIVADTARALGDISARLDEALKVL